MLPSSVVGQTIPVMPGGGLGGALGGMFGGKDATRAEQLAQIVIAKEQLSHLFQAIESLQMGNELKVIFEQMYGIQSTVEDVLVHEPPQRLVARHDLINPSEHKRLTEERNTYLNEIDTEFAAIKSDIALDPNQMTTLTMAAQRIEEPRSDIVATQAQFLADQTALEQDRRKIAVELIDSRHAEIRNQVVAAQVASRDAALKCIREKKSTNDC